MNEFSVDRYLVERVDDQIAWYDNKAVLAQKWYMRIQIAQIIIAASIPVLTTLLEVCSRPLVTVGIACCGYALVVLQGINRLKKFHENWISYRTTCELLKNEKHLFISGSHPYNSKDETEENIFIRRIETLISSENNQWKSLQQVAEKDKKED